MVVSVPSHSVFDLFVSGIDHSISGSGGEKCIQYIPMTQRFYETIFFSVIFVISAKWNWSRFNKLSVNPDAKITQPKSLLLCALSLSLLVELCYKIVTRSLIWILNPCHVITILQLPGEHFIFFVQHSFILAVPILLIDQSTPYSIEPLDDVSCPMLSLSIQVLYHFLVLQPIGLLTGVNLNNMLCPAPSDPFKGRYYRIIAMMHQPPLILCLGKLLSTAAICCLRNQPLPWLPLLSHHTRPSPTSLVVDNGDGDAGSKPHQLSPSSIMSRWPPLSPISHTPDKHQLGPLVVDQLLRRPTRTGDE